MRRKDWTVSTKGQTAQTQARHHSDTTLRLLLFGERAARVLFATALVVATAAVCVVALMGPEALASAQAETLPNMLSRMRLALSGMFG